MNLPHQVDAFSQALGAAGDGWQVAAVKADFQSRRLGESQQVDKRAVTMEKRLESPETITLTVELIR